MFSVTFLPTPFPGAKISERILIKGEITMGAFSEKFESCLCRWSMDDYERQWSRSIARIVRGARRSAIITSIHTHESEGLSYWWPIYRVHDLVYIQNSLLFLSKLPSTFDPKEPYREVPRRQTISSTGEKISEWTLRVQDFRDFLRQLARPV